MKTETKHEKIRNEIQNVKEYIKLIHFTYGVDIIDVEINVIYPKI